MKWYFPCSVFYHPEPWDISRGRRRRRKRRLSAEAPATVLLVSATEDTRSATYSLPLRFWKFCFFPNTFFLLKWEYIRWDVNKKCLKNCVFQCKIWWYPTVSICKLRAQNFQSFCLDLFKLTGSANTRGGIVMPAPAAFRTSGKNKSFQSPKFSVILFRFI